MQARSTAGFLNKQELGCFYRKYLNCSVNTTLVFPSVNYEREGQTENRGDPLFIKINSLRFCKCSPQEHLPPPKKKTFAKIRNYSVFKVPPVSSREMLRRNSSSRQVALKPPHARETKHLLFLEQLVNSPTPELKSCPDKLEKVWCSYLEIWLFFPPQPRCRLNPKPSFKRSLALIWPNINL